MKTYYIDYLDKSGDLTHIWVEAESKQDAESEARSEYWDIDEILEIREGR